ncbi:hypothetical protein Mapa_016378 [Marchantia paleacea]|nr:hypothetical protein Mapa_016378 [Marchantia paleacea]
MSFPGQKWLRGLQSSSLFRPPPESAIRKQAEILAYVELFGHFASESFVDDIGELVRAHYPTNEHCLLDDVLATFVLHHPEHGHAVLHALLSCVIDGTLIYNKKTPPFGSFVSLFSPSTERDFSEQWALACGETLRVLTHYNRPTFKSDTGQPSGSNRSPSSSGEGSGKGSQARAGWDEYDRRSPTRLLTPWITDSLLAAPPSIRSDYFQWCGGVMGKYTAGEELRPPTTAVGGRSQGKQPQLLPSTPRWAVANGAAVILSVCDDEVSRYETADLTAAAVPALLIPPPTAQNENLLVSGIPFLEPYAHLFHRYYAVATPGATQRLLFGLLEAPPTWAPDALVVALALVELLRAADNYTSSVQLPRDWLTIHFLRPVGAAMAQRSGTAADAAAAILYHIFSRPALLFPPPSQSQGLFSTQTLLYGTSSLAASREEAKAAAAQASEVATASGLAALMTGHGIDVECHICALWEAAYGLRPLTPSSVDLPDLVLSTPLQPPVLSWNLLRALFRILSYLPPDSPSQACLKRIFSATVEAILQRTFPLDEVKQQKDGTIVGLQAGGGGTGAKSVAMGELRAMLHCLFTESFLSPELAAHLLSEALSLCLSHDASRQSERRIATWKDGGSSLTMEEDIYEGKEIFRTPTIDVAGKQRGAVATFDSYVIAAVCALACEVQFFPLSPAYFTIMKLPSVVITRPDADGQVSSSGARDGQRSVSLLSNRFPIGVANVLEHTKRLLGLLELLLGVSPSFAGTGCSNSSTSTNEILGQAVGAAHMSDLLGHSRACLHSLTGIMRCKWDPGICSKASAVLSAIESNGDLVAMATHGRNGFGGPDCTVGMKRDLEEAWNASIEDQLKPSQLQKLSRVSGLPGNLRGGSSEQAPKIPNGYGPVGEARGSFPLEASDVASLLCKDRRNGRYGTLDASLKSVLVGKQHLAIGATALLCQRLILAPDIPNAIEGTSAERGWGQVVEALCNISAAFPGKVARFVVSQAEAELRPWTIKDDGPSQQSLWRINTRVVCLLSELLRLTHLPEIVKVVVHDGAILRRATDGMTLDGEACKLPQLELLEAAALAAQAALKWEEPNEEVADQLFSLLRERLPATVRCLSHNSTHVRAMSVARLRDMLYMESLRSSSSRKSSEGSEREESTGTGNWRRYVEQCVVWEVHCRRAGGMSISLLANAASALGCPIPV